MTKYELIYKMQGELNTLVSRNTIGSVKKESWLFDYAQALADEVAELRNCINWKWWAKESKENGQYSTIIDLENAKIEAIDCLHFIISIIQILDVDIKQFGREDVLDYYFEHFQKLYREAKTIPATDLFLTCERMDDRIRLLKNTTSWDSGALSPTTIRDKDAAVEYTQHLWEFLIYCFVILGMTPADILKIYELKHEKNVKRQENDYSVANKTEDDNDEIKKQI